MDRIAKALDLIEQAKKLGVRMEFQDGLNLLKTPAPLDSEFSTQLAKYLPEIRVLMQGRAIAALAKKLIGARIVSHEHGAGRLVDAATDGALTISVGTEVRKSRDDESRLSQISITAAAEHVLIVVDEAPENGAVVDAAKPEENKRMGVFEFLRRRSAGSDGGGN
jgi:hypothetical protein